MNRWIGSGQVVKTAFRRTQRGQPYAWMSLQCHDDEGRVDFLDVVFWDALAERVRDFARVDEAAEVTGKVRRRGFTDGQGQRVFRTEIVADAVWFPSIRPAVDV